MNKRIVRILVTGVTLLSLSRLAAAQDTIPFVPSPMHVVQKMIEVADIKKGDVLYDMGSGDGRIIIEAAKKYGVRGVGIDLNPDLVAKVAIMIWPLRVCSTRASTPWFLNRPFSTPTHIGAMVSLKPP